MQIPALSAEDRRGQITLRAEQGMTKLKHALHPVSFGSFLLSQPVFDLSSSVPGAMLLPMKIKSFLLLPCLSLPFSLLQHPCQHLSVFQNSL